MTIEVLPTGQVERPASKFRNCCVMLTTRITKRYTLFGRRPRGACCDRRAREVSPPAPQGGTVLRSDAMRRSSSITRRMATRGLLASAVLTVTAVSTLSGTAGASSALGKRPSGHAVARHDRPHQRRRWQQLHRHRRTRQPGRHGGRRLRERIRRWPRGSQDRPLHLREPVDPGRRPDLRQRHGPEGRRRRRRALHRAGPDRGAHHHRCRHPLHHAQRGIDRRAHHAGFLRHRRRLPGLPGRRGAERQAARLLEGRSPGGERAGRHPGRAGARRPRLQGGGRRASR